MAGASAPAPAGELHPGLRCRAKNKQRRLAPSLITAPPRAQTALPGPPGAGTPLTHGVPSPRSPPPVPALVPRPRLDTAPASPARRGPGGAPLLSLSHPVPYARAP